MELFGFPQLDSKSEVGLKEDEEDYALDSESCVEVRTILTLIMF